MRDAFMALLVLLVARRLRGNIPLALSGRGSVTLGAPDGPVRDAVPIHENASLCTKDMGSGSHCGAG